MIKRKAKQVWTIFQRAVHWKIWMALAITQILLFEHILWEFMLVVPKEEQNFILYFVHQMSDRFVILLGSGLGLAYIFYRIFHTQTKVWITIRMENEKHNDILSELLIGMISFFFLLMQVIFVIVIAVFGGIPLHFFGGEWFIIPKILFNLFGFYVTFGNAILLIQKIFKKKVILYLLSVSLLILNFGISNGTAFLDKWIGKISWIGNVMVLDMDAYACNFFYWLSWNILFLMILGYIRSKEKVRHLFCANWKKYLFFAGGTVLIFGVYAMVSKESLFIAQSTAETLLQDYFSGFDKIGVLLFLYLFYQLPIWLVIYQYLIKNFASYGIWYFIRMGSVKKYLLRLFFEAAVYIVLYYILGAVVLFLCNFHLITQIKLSVIYMGFFLSILLILQTMFLILLGFGVSMAEESEKNLGFISVLVLHLFFVTIAKKYPIVAKWCPFIQGIYWINKEHFLFSLVYQIIWIAALLCIIIAYLGLYQNDVVERKIKRA